MQAVPKTSHIIPETYQMTFTIEEASFPFLEDMVEEFPDIVMTAAPDVSSALMQVQLYAETEKTLQQFFVNILGLFSPDQHAQLNMKIEAVAAQDWVAKSQEGFAPFQAGDFYISPHKEDSFSSDDHIALHIQAGHAFGTGTHESTSLCLALITEYTQRTPSLEKALDMGCGTGILAMAVAKQFPQSQIWAVDNDIKAIEVTKSNCQLNNVTHNIEIYQADQLDPTLAQQGPFQLITANLFANLIIQMLPRFTQNLADDGYLILSGLLTKQLESLRPHVASDYDLIQHLQKNEWSAWLLKKKPCA